MNSLGGIIWNRNQPDPWDLFTWFLRERRDLFLPLLVLAPEIEERLRECFGFARGTWPYRILSALAEEGPCNLRMISKKLFPSDNNSHQKWRLKELRLALEWL